MGNPGQCAKVIAGAIGSRLPRSRYLVGIDAQAMSLMETLSPTKYRRNPALRNTRR